MTTLTVTESKVPQEGFLGTMNMWRRNVSDWLCQPDTAIVKGISWKYTAERTEVYHTSYATAKLCGHARHKDILASAGDVGRNMQSYYPQSFNAHIVWEGPSYTPKISDSNLHREWAPSVLTST